MRFKQIIGTVLAFALAGGPLHAADQKTEAAGTFDAAVSGITAAEEDGQSGNPFNKQDDKEVQYDRSRWIQPKSWNTPTVDPRDYEGGIMLFFDKIGLFPEYAPGKVQRVYFSLVGATEPVSSMKFHFFYDTRLKVKPNSKGEAVTPGTAVADFATGSAMVEEGQIAFYASSDHDIAVERGSIFTVDFIIPEDAEPGDLYPLGLAYVDDGIVPDLFINSAKDGAGILQMTYVFTKGIYNGYIKIIGEKATTAATETTTTVPDPVQPLIGDVDCSGTVTVADAVLLCRIAAEDPCDGIPLTEENFYAADFDMDDRITVMDAASLLAYLQINLP